MCERRLEICSIDGSILDPKLKELVISHLNNYNNNVWSDLN